MTEERILSGLDGSDPLGFLAAIGLLRVVSRFDAEAKLRFVHSGRWIPTIITAHPSELEDLVLEDLARFRSSHPALDFARVAAHAG